ncbi:Uncharacterized membrane-anchored protein [hydrothermal vent metagenome]|uniref:Uncharacterized membrane-anchored protein n=1 Tax=hydrothermal vent metagenome TaxID=652676 RepID=A0A3B0TW54_9ZZZZ
MSTILDHPQRYQLANELHARPFPAVEAPCQAVFLAIKKPINAVNRDRGLDYAHLLSLLDHFGAPHPQPEATHYSGELNPEGLNYKGLKKLKLKWEMHTEFVTYTLFTQGIAGRPFDPAVFDIFPAEWLAKTPGSRMTSALLQVEIMPEKIEDIQSQLLEYFEPESIAVSYVLDKSAIISGDYRIDDSGHLRFGIFVKPGTGEQRIGRILQRLTEIEIYKSMSMLALPRARYLSRRLAQIDIQVSELVSAMKNIDRAEEDTLSEILSISAELEDLMAQTSFRFSATAAYNAIVEQRVQVLREERFGGRQTFYEFMMRRYDPAMRTIKSTETHLVAMAERVKRAGDLLRTRVEVDRSAQNQALLKSMDQRAALQLRLQRTVEGLSVVAISYYAINLVSYGFAPFAKQIGIDKPTLTGIAMPLVLLAVWWVVRRIRKSH